LATLTEGGLLAVSFLPSHPHTAIAAAAIANASASSKAATEPAPPAPVTYETSGIKEIYEALKAKMAAGNDAEFKKRVVDTIKAHGGVNAEGKASPSSIPPANFTAAKAALEELVKA